jgi:hypothetical protein
MLWSLLVVDPDRHVADTLALTANKCRSGVTICTSFEEAEREIRMRAPLIVLAHAVIGRSQGVHLAQAAIRANRLARVVIYGSPADLMLAHKMFRTRVFFERETFVRYSLPRYLTADLPPLDRRDVRTVDRRTTFRGGRRASDIEMLRGPRLAGVPTQPAKSQTGAVTATPPPLT